MKRGWKRLRWEPDDINDLRNRLNRNISLLNAFNGRITRNNITKLMQSHNDHENRMILDWLSPMNYATQQSNFASRCQAETGKWFLKSSEFQTWIEKPKQTLFCPGIPGAGKTILVSMMIDELYVRYGNENDIGIAYIYFNFRHRYENGLKDLLASLLKQLAQAQLSLPDNVRDLYGQHYKRGTLPSLDQISRNLHAVISKFTKVFIVVDALDECENVNKLCYIFLSKIFHLQNKHELNFLATSRFIPEIEAMFEGTPCLEIQANSEDVKRYLRESLGCLPRFVSRSTELQEEITAEITKNIGGMFLLAQLHLESLIGKKSPKALRVALASFSSGCSSYDSAYHDIMERVQRQMKDQKEMAIQVLSWITYAKRQLTTLELQHALAVEIDSPCLDKHNLPELDDMVSVCAGLVTVDEESKVIRLIHYTAQVYLLRTANVWFPNAQAYISRTCITYLSFEVFGAGPSLSEESLKDRLSSNTLYDYTTRNWGHHTRMSSIESEKWILDFVESKQKVAACSQTMVYNEYHDFTESQMTNLHLAAYFGLQKLVLALLERQHDPNLKDGYGRTPLSWAADCGHEEAVWLLLEKGADLNAADKDGWTPLEWAAMMGHTALVNLFLDRYASHSSRDNGGTIILSLAAENGYESLVKLLLDRGIYPDFKNSFGESPLLLAADNGHEMVVELLLSRGAGIDSKNKYGLTPLLSAANNGHEIVVRLLLDKGASIEAKDRYGRTSLLSAAENGHEAVVKLLLDKGADLKSKDCHGWSSLSWAYNYGYRHVMSLLLEKGAVFESEMTPMNSTDRVMAGAQIYRFKPITFSRK
ncbi:ankyrin repeat-containing domain protein [Talaromyces proteolyticus]|uniref:Ankyrin repeat-containing domain protein n=1 Tax=Talaromyces proteolyticus TaxID=1131652 RepID=A0AAD4KJS3_9EURO|nr:ankyrin repeat-containing domain protein [Talaromyces proteolyticus]KAH8692876.1 ankyrin repeat-containing domain protein [Talaromyces proteolyticus]